jgi:hypothetical protein
VIYVAIVLHCQSISISLAGETADTDRRWELRWFATVCILKPLKEFQLFIEGQIMGWLLDWQASEPYALVKQLGAFHLSNYAHEVLHFPTLGTDRDPQEIQDCLAGDQVGPRRMTREASEQHTARNVDRFEGFFLRESWLIAQPAFIVVIGARLVRKYRQSPGRDVARHI